MVLYQSDLLGKPLQSFAPKNLGTTHPCSTIGKQVNLTFFYNDRNDTLDANFLTTVYYTILCALPVTSCHLEVLL